MLTKAPKGTKDMLPEEAYRWHYIEKAFADICERYGFTETGRPCSSIQSCFTGA